MKTEITLHRVTLENLIKVYEHHLETIDDEYLEEYYRGLHVAYKSMLILFEED